MFAFADGYVAFLLYDYAITFGQEVEFFWKRKANSGTILYFATGRYIALIWYTLNILGSASMSDKVWLYSSTRCSPLIVVLSSVEVRSF